MKYNKYSEYTDRVYKISDIKLYNHIKKEYIAFNYKSNKRHKTMITKFIKDTCKNGYNQYSFNDNRDIKIRNKCKQYNMYVNLVSILIKDGKSYYIYEINDFIYAG